MDTTRQTLAGLSHWQVVVWYLLAALSTGVFIVGVVLLVHKYRAGRGVRPAGSSRRRTGSSLRLVFTHASIGRGDRSARLAHVLTFYGFLVLFLGTAILAVQDDIAGPLGWHFWRDSFYLGYSLFLDVFGLALTIGVLVFVVRRANRPRRLDYRRVDGRSERYDRRRYVAGDWILVGSLLFLAVSGFLLEAVRIAETNPSFERWSPCGWLLAQALRAGGLEGATATDVHLALWWLHGLAALAFVAAIPFTKAVHMLVDPASLAVRDGPLGAILPPAAGATSDEPPGYGVITDLAPKHLVQLDACTKCGNCHVVCPATATGLPLSPRDLILDLREHAEGALGIRRALRVPPLAPETEDLATVIPSETLWSCMQCLACVEACPVGVEHPPIIVDLRRRRVDAGDLDQTLQSTLEAIYTTGNSFGLTRRRRGRWAEELDFGLKDARAGRCRAPLVPRRLRFARAAQPGGDPCARVDPAHRRRRRRDPLRGGAERRQRRPASR